MFLHTYIRVSKFESNQSVKNLGLVKQLKFITLYLDIFTSVKSHDFNYQLFQHSIRKLCRLEPKDIFQFHRRGIELLLEQRKTFIPRDVIVNIQPSCKIYKFDFLTRSTVHICIFLLI